MAWDPSVLRKYNSTGHFRLLNQLRSELKANPLVRPKEGERIADVNRSRALVRALEGASGSGRSRRSSRATSGADTNALESQATAPILTSNTADEEESGNAGFRERLNAVDLR